MTGLPIDLQKLPPQALDVIRFLGTQDEGALVDDIMASTGLSQRAFGKAIRALVTRKYATMPERDYYVLTGNGRDAAQTLREHNGEAATASPASVPEPEPAPAEPAIAWHRRRISAFMPKEMVEHAPAPLRVGFDAPKNDANPLHEPARMILRVSVPDCTVEPLERPLEVRPGGAAGPVRFRITPERAGPARVRIEAFQLVGADELIPAGGVYFDLPVSEFPTPNSAEFQTLAAMLRLHPGEDHA